MKNLNNSFLHYFTERETTTNSYLCCKLIEAEGNTFKCPKLAVTSAKPNFWSQNSLMRDLRAPNWYPFPFTISPGHFHLHYSTKTSQRYVVTLNQKALEDTAINEKLYISYQ